MSDAINAKLEYLAETKSMIAEAIKEKGVEVSTSDTFRMYASKISQIETEDKLKIAIEQSIPFEASYSLSSPVSMFHNAFYNCQNLYLDNVLSIGIYTFYGCTELKKANLPSCTILGQSAFYNCTKLEETNLPSCTTIGHYAFYNCTKLEETNLPSCTTLGNYVFANCSNLSFINLPNCTSIGTSVFYKCTKLEEISLSNCTKIPTGAFYSCHSLKSVDLPNCQTLANSVFAYCSNLSFISLPKCSSMANSIFYGCSKLESVYLYSSSIVTINSPLLFAWTPISESKFIGHFGSIYVPSSLVDAYKSATNWSVYADRITSIVEE